MNSVLTGETNSPQQIQFIAFSFLKRMLAADKEFYSTLGLVMDDQI